MRIKGVYQGSTLIGHVQGIVKASANPSQPTVEAWRYRDYASQGWKTEYQAIETQWLVVKRSDIPKARVQRFSGAARLADLETIWLDLVAHIDVQPAQAELTPNDIKSGAWKEVRP